MKQMISLFTILAMLALVTSCTNSNHFNKLPSISHQAFQYIQQANMLTYNKKYDEAISCFNKAIQLMPSNIHFLLGRGRTYFLNGKNSEAMADFNRAIELEPNYAYAYLGRGAVYMKDDKLDKAIIEFSMATQINPDFAEAYLYRGVAFEKSGEINMADLDKKRAKELKPKVAPVFLRMIPEINDAGDNPPRVIRYVPPRYPFEARSEHITGRVIVNITVTKDGVVKDPVVFESTPEGVFDEAAIDCVKKWLFTPATEDGKPVDKIVRVPLTFNISSEETKQ
jgi:TonB family protein